MDCVHGSEKSCLLQLTLFHTSCSVPDLHQVEQRRQAKAKQTIEVIDIQQTEEGKRCVAMVRM